MNSQNYNLIDKGKYIIFSLIFLSFLVSMKIWLCWEDRTMYINWFIGLGAILISFVSNIKFDFSKTNILLCICVFVSQLYNGSKFGLWFMLAFLPYITIICLNSKDKALCLRYITMWFGYLMVPSILIYILCNTIDLPALNTQQALSEEWAEQSGYGICKNYIFYMKSEFDNYGLRFNGPFLEPGHLGMMGAFLLFVNKFDFSRKGMFFILLAVLLSLSLAGYVLLVIGYFMILFYNNKIRLKHLIVYSLLLLVAYNIGIYYNDGNNLVNELIISRLQSDDEKGFAGNNRVFGMMEIYYLGLFSDIKLFLYGYSRDVMEWLAETGSRGSGYMVYMCWYGFVGVILSFILYLIVFFKSKVRLFAFLALMFVLLMFWQRCYPNWTSWIICYLYGITSEELKNY